MGKLENGVKSSQLFFHGFWESSIRQIWYYCCSKLYWSELHIVEHNSSFVWEMSYSENHMLNFVIWWDLDLDFLFENISMCLKAVSFDGPKDFYLIPRFSGETVKDTSMSQTSVSFVRSLKVETGVMGGKMRWINGRVGSPRLNCLIMITFDIIVWIDCLYFILYEGGRGWGGGVKMMVFF